jgi:uncharacterized tellurite resistance protein B-like protein
MVCERGMKAVIGTDMLKTLTSLLDRLAGPKQTERLGDDDLRTASAALLVHAMAIDGMVREEEAERLRHLIAAHFGLPPDDVNRLLIEAERQERDSIDIYRFTSVLRDRLSLDQKRDIIAMMWRVVFADGRLEALEDNLIWRTAELLAVPTRDRMQLKQMVRGETGTGTE